MKKLLALAFLCTAAMSFAGIDYGLEAGQNRLGVYGGMSVPRDWDWNGVSMSPGNTGPLFGVEFLHNITPLFALGLDINYASYGEKKNYGIGFDSKLFGASAEGRLNFMAEQAGRVYIPFGVGLSKLDTDGSSAGNASQTGVSFFAGAGFEFDLDPTWVLGIEGRYFYMPLDKDKFTDNKFSSLNVLLKLGARF